jgi:hypothetical protein
MDPRPAPAPRPARARRAAALAGALLCALGLPALATPACCKDPDAFPYEALPASGAVDFAIDAASPQFVFQTGPSAFHAFRLPVVDRPYLLEVQSFVDGGPDPRHAHVFYPLVAVLTDDFLVSRLTELEYLRFDLPFFERASAPAYRLVVPFDPKNTEERYLVVFTPAAFAEPRPVPTAATPEAAAEAARAAFLGSAPYGRLRITLEFGETPAAEPAR